MAERKEWGLFNSLILCCLGWEDDEFPQPQVQIQKDTSDEIVKPQKTSSMDEIARAEIIDMGDPTILDYFSNFIFQNFLKISILPRMKKNSAIKTCQVRLLRISSRV